MMRAELSAAADGLPVPIGGDVRWQETVGTSPYVARFEVEKDAANQLFFEHAGLFDASLTLSAGRGEPPVTFGGLTILGTSATSSDHTLYVDVADSRWFLPRASVLKSYNVRRKSGLIRRLGTAGAAPARAVVADFEYAPWSLNNGSVWTPQQILEDVMDTATARMPVFWAFAGSMPEFPDVEGLEIDGSGDAAIAQVIAALGGGIGVRVRRSDGAILLFDRLDNSERELVGAPAAADGTAGNTTTRAKSGQRRKIVGPPLWAVQSRELERPKSVRVLFDRVFELRVDYQEHTTPAGDVTAEDFKGVPLAENVIRTPQDISKADGGGVAYDAGSWVDLATYLVFLSKQDLPDGPGGKDLPAITLDTIQRGWLSPALDIYGMLDTSGVWSARIAALREHYRRTFRLRRPWVDRIRGMRAVLAAVTDTETHGQISSPVYQDFAQFNTWRNPASGAAAFGDPALMEVLQNSLANGDPTTGGLGGNIVGTPFGFSESSLFSLSPAPAVVNVLDEDQALFQIDFVNDFTGQSSGYVHSAIENRATEDLSQPALWLQEGKLQTTWEFSTILLVRPAVPNNTNRREEREIRPPESEAAFGPALDVRAPSNVVARYAWPDNPTEDEKLLSLLAEGLPRAGPLFALNEDQLVETAQAVARRVYTMFRDRIDGGLTTRMEPEITPRGTTTAVVHSVGPGGALTEVVLDPEPEPRDLMSYMPGDVRRAVDGFVDL